MLEILAQLRKRHHVSREVLDIIENHYSEQLSMATAALDAVKLNKAYKNDEELVQLQRHNGATRKSRRLEARRQGTIAPDTFIELLADIDARYLELDSAEKQQDASD